MCRVPLRIPGDQLPGVITYNAKDEVFLEMLKPWAAIHYREGLENSPRTNARIALIKEDIRNQLYTIQNRYCAFCGIDLDIAREVHREHIASQSSYPEYIFHPENLVLACYDCNDFKGRRNVVGLNTNNYDTTTFIILHPYRDDYGNYLVAFYENGGLWFEVLPGVTDARAKATIDKLGLEDFKLIKERGMRIKCALISNTQQDDEYVRAICSIAPRIAN